LNDYISETDINSDGLWNNNVFNTTVQETKLIDINDEKMDNLKAIKLEKMKLFNENKLKILRRFDNDYFEMKTVNKITSPQNLVTTDFENNNHQVTLNESVSKMFKNKQKEEKIAYLNRLDAKTKNVKFASDDLKNELVKTYNNYITL